MMARHSSSSHPTALIGEEEEDSITICLFLSRRWLTESQRAEEEVLNWSF